jgi:hypothetical protein
MFIANSPSSKSADAGILPGTLLFLFMMDMFLLAMLSPD